MKRGRKGKVTSASVFSKRAKFRDSLTWDLSFLSFSSVWSENEGPKELEMSSLFEVFIFPIDVPLCIFFSDVLGRWDPWEGGGGESVRFITWVCGCVITEDDGGEYVAVEIEKLFEYDELSFCIWCPGEGGEQRVFYRKEWNLK